MAERSLLVAGLVLSLGAQEAFLNEGDRPLSSVALRPPRAPHAVSGQSPATTSVPKQPPPAAQESAIPSLAGLSLEELGNIDITSVLKRPERLSQAAAAVCVITREDIRRSGATTLPEALRLAPNLQVAQVDSSQYTIGARGLNISNVNKLLVLMDGRTVYSALHSGVFWDAQDTPLGDIDRIEVISGPGGSLWGSNAVNGIINILTRRAQETEGTLVTGAVGDRDRLQAGARYGGRWSNRASYRVYGQYLARDGAVKATGASSRDDWRRVQGGFRFDWSAGSDTLTLQGDAYQARIHQAALSAKRIDGANLVGRWGRTWSPDSSLEVQVYVDRTHRDHPSVFAETVTTFDLEATHRFRLGDRQELVWGGGYRVSRDAMRNSPLLSFLPPNKELTLANLFAQDSLALIPERLILTLGAKLERNVYTGWEFQPSARLAWKPKADHLLWAAVSRAVRTPSRLDRDFYVDFTSPPPAPPLRIVIDGGPTFRSESVVAFEAGYRVQPRSGASLSVSPFYSVYRDLRSIDLVRHPTPLEFEYQLMNHIEGHAYGAELWGDVLVTDAWRLKPAYAYLRTSFRLAPGSTDPVGPSSAGNDARHRFQVTSHWNVKPNLEIDGTLRHVSALPNPAVPAHWDLNVRLGWRLTPHLELSLVGQNLLNKRHPEFGPPATRREIERGWIARVAWTF